MRLQLVRHFDSTARASCSRLNLAAATFGTTSHAFKKANQMPPRPTLPDSDLRHVYLKGSGPGGQKINKTNSACQLTHIPTGIVVKSQATRSRSQNHNIARSILAEKIELLEKGEDSRVAIKTIAASKRKASKRKKALRKYRKLGEGKDNDDDDAEPELELEDEFDEGASGTESTQGSDENLLEAPRTIPSSAKKPGNMRTI